MHDNERLEVSCVGVHVVDDSNTKLDVLGLVSIQLLGESVKEAVSCNAMLAFSLQKGCVGRYGSRGMYVPLPAVSAAYTLIALRVGWSSLRPMMYVSSG